MAVEDLSIYMAEFGQDAPLNGGTPIRVIFDKPYVVAGGVAVGSDPTAMCLESLGVVSGNTLLIDGTTYKVINPEPDGKGMAILQLEQQ